MFVYGADFSGAKNPSDKIYYARCELKGNQIIVDEINKCDDRLDLYHEIISTNAPWGLDFPFALPEAGYQALGISGWAELLKYAVSSERDQFTKNSPLTYLSCQSKHSGSRNISKDFWRETDIASNAFSPLKQNNPNMLAMTYAGLKLLAYLRDQGVRVYPFDTYSASSSRVYEVYPSNTWAYLKLKRTNDVSLLSNDLIKGLSCSLVNIVTANQDAADAVIAAVTLAVGIAVHGVEKNWGSPPGCATKNEWAVRKKEGLIIRLK